MTGDAMSDPTPEPTPFTEPSPSPELTPFSGPEPSETAASDAAVSEPTGVDSAHVPPAAEPVSKPARGPRQTLAGRVWVAIACAAILLVLIIIFIAENSRSVTISFLGAHGHISLGLAMLIAVVAGSLIALLVGSARIVQLTMEVRRHRRKLRELV